MRAGSRAPPFIHLSKRIRACGAKPYGRVWGRNRVDAEALQDIAARVCACTRCPLHETRTRAVPGEGGGVVGGVAGGVAGAGTAGATPTGTGDAVQRGRRQPTSAGRTPFSGVMCVGEAPGRNEDATGRPFCGAAGKNLDLGLAAAGLAREAVFITSIVKCRPPKNRDPKPGEKQACRPYLEEQVDALQPRVLVALGRHGLSGLVGDAPKAFASVRGRFLDGPVDAAGLPIPVFCSLHPAAIIYRRAWREAYLADWAWFGGWMRGGRGVPADRRGAI